MNSLAMQATDSDAVAGSLYVLLDRLHRSLALPDVVTAIQEAIVNLVGSEDHALFVRDDTTGRFEPLYALGEAQSVPSFVAGEGPFGAAALARAISWTLPIAVPLYDRQRGCIGLVAMLKLLRHKRGLDARDRALLEALSAHAGVALEAALCAAAGPPSWDVSRVRTLLGGTR
jgi:hypothetical protein